MFEIHMIELQYEVHKFNVKLSMKSQTENKIDEIYTVSVLFFSFDILIFLH